MTRCVAIADTHCGSFLGLTPPKWQTVTRRDPQIAKLQRRLWKFYYDFVQKVAKPPVDVLFFLGDAIEGPEEKNRGIDLLEPSLFDQVRMAVDALRILEPRKSYIVRGTPYHTGDAEDWEDELASPLHGVVADSMRVRVEKVWFDLAHHVGKSIVPYGKGTPLAREYVLGTLLSLYRKDVPQAHVYLRGHVHYYAYVGGADWLAMSVPALSYGGGKIARKAKGAVEIGAVLFEVDGEEWRWRADVQVVAENTAVLVAA